MIKVSISSTHLRALGYDAGRAGKYLEASIFYKQAADNYPTKEGALAKKDIKKLLTFSNQYRKAWEHQQKEAQS